MTNERSLFDAALDIDDLAKRHAFLAEACAEDEDLLRKVSSLLEAHEKAHSFLDAPALNLLIPNLDLTPPIHELNKTSDYSVCPEREGSAIGVSENSDFDGEGTDDEKLEFSFLQPPMKPTSIGTLGHYEILQLLGQGGFGIVFKAFDQKLHRVVAIKVMNPQLASTSPPRKRFLREARAVAAIKHENVVQVYSVEEQPLPFMVMEFIDGQTLQQKVDANGPLEINEVLYLGRQMASALASAHALGIIHRDIKPGNILLEQGTEQKVKITDFGLARTVDDASMTHTGLISGTPMYMAPEQALGQSLDHRTDLFSLGSVLYQLACGRPPFRAPNTVAVLRRVAEDTPRHLQEIMPELPDWLVAIINKLLAKRPEDRYQSAKELEEVLARCRTELQASGKVTGLEGLVAKPPQHVLSNSKKQDDIVAAKLAQPSWGWILYFMMLGAIVTLPFVFGKHLSSYVNAWIWPAIPVLPETAVSEGLEFDGKDDFISIEALDWSYPQFTVEAFVTSDKDSDNGTILHLGGDGDMPEWMSLYDDHQADPGRRLSGASIQGKTPFANASAPLTAGLRQHRVLVFDGRYMHYYVNGIWQAKRYAEAHEGLMWNMRKLRIACDGNQRRFFQGRIDQVRISKVARYDDNFEPITRLTNDQSTLALYNFDDGSGDLLRDASGHGHDGKIFGATWVAARKTLENHDASPVTELPRESSSSKDVKLQPSDLVISPDHEWSTPVPLGANINTSGREASPTLTDDELLIVFTRDNVFYEARRATRDELFGPAQKLAGPFKGTAKGLPSGSLSGDGLLLAFSSGILGEEHADVILTSRPDRDAPFEGLDRLPEPINSPGTDQHPVLSPNGLTLALTSIRLGGRPGETLIFSRPSRKDPFNGPAIIEPALQEEWDVVSCFAADGRGLLKTTMALSTETITWHSRADAKTPYSRGVKLQPPFDELTYGAPVLSADGMSLYFHSRSLPQGQGNLDLWVSRRIPKKNRESMPTLSRSSDAPPPQITPPVNDQQVK